jgi:hypothetical protein
MRMPVKAAMEFQSERKRKMNFFAADGVRLAYSHRRLLDESSDRERSKSRSGSLF